MSAAIAPELAARIRKVAAENPELTYRTLGTRFGISWHTIANLLKPAPGAPPRPRGEL